MQPEGALQTLIQSLRCLPGVGAKSAQRMAFFLLQQDREGARRLAHALSKAAEKITYCSHCRTFSELEICSICANTARNTEQLCILENPSDVWSIEQAGFYQGRYFVLHGRLSPLDGIGPEQLNIDLLEKRLLEGSIKELVLATNSTVEGEATAHFIAGLANKYTVKATRIAHGVPMGGELEYIDSGTLAHAFNGRQIMDL